MFLFPQDIADPFFAYCKQHADRFDRKWKRKNYLALQSYCKVSLQEREKQLTPEAQVGLSHSYRLQLPHVRTVKHVHVRLLYPNMPIGLYEEKKIRKIFQCLDICCFFSGVVNIQLHVNCFILNLI